MPSQSRPPSQSRLTRHAQKLVRLVSLETSQTSHSLNIDSTNTYTIPKTSLKTLRYIDDEAPLISALETLNEAARTTTGKDLTKRDLEALNELFKIIINETDIARTRTKSVSSYIKFAAENLRRRLYSKPLSAIGKTKQLEPGSDDKKEMMPAQEIEESEIQPLSGASKENALVIFRSIVRESGIGAMENFRALHTPEDFEWLMEKLK